MNAGEVLFRTIAVALAFVLLSVGSTTAAGEFDEFGFESVGAEESTASAGAHPDFTTKFTLSHTELPDGKPVVSARTEDVVVDLPPGLMGNPNSVLRCTNAEFLSWDCPLDSQVGIVRVQLASDTRVVTEPLYSLDPAHGGDAVARLGFAAVFYPAFIDVSIRTAGDYGITAALRDASGQAPIVSAEAVLWGVPAAPIHDPQRLTPFEAINCFETGTACQAAGGKRSSGLPERPFLTNPTACQGMRVDFLATSYQLPGQVFEAAAPMAPIVDCGKVPFNASLDVEPTNPVAGAPTGLRTTLHLQQIEDVNTPAASAMKAAKVTLPEGMAVSPGAVHGIETCSDEQVGFHREVPPACPDAAKVGEALIDSPSLPGVLGGSVYLRTPQPGNQFRLWLVAEGFGMHVKLPGEIHADARTGQLTTEFSETPQVPIERIELELWGGDRAPLKNPDACGTYAASYELTPWSGNPPVAGQAQIAIDRGCGKGFNPRLEAGVTDPVAGAFSPLIVNLFREDGDDNVAGLEVSLPKGLLAKLRGVPLCPPSAGACPSDSRIGSVAVSVGAGPLPLWLPQPGKGAAGVFLSGPYGDAPYSVVVEVPARAGPFDLGTVVVRSGLHVDPETGQASVKTAALPQFVEGVAATYRAIHVKIDRPDFVVNPTSCEEKAFRSTVTSAGGLLAHPAHFFQVEGCKRLKFSPRLSLKLRGGTERGDYPALTATLKAKEGHANIRRVSVALPRSEFLAQEHIQTICTRVRFAAGDCPKRSVYGYAKAWTPLLDKPLRGPVYLRSSNHPLPDLVAALDGQLDIDLVGRIDSHKGGIRTTFSSVPDAPVTRFVLKMKGGKKGLLTNSRDICRSRGRATVQMDAQNGRIRDFKAALHAQCNQSKRR